MCFQPRKAFPMRIVFFGNRQVAVDILIFLKNQGEDIVGLVLNDSGQRALGDEIIHASGLPASSVISASEINDPATIEQFRMLNADIGFSAFFGHILKPQILSLFPKGVLNVHPGYLPYNRGRNTQVWSIVDHTPAGATLHYMNEGIDTGPIIERIEVPVSPDDTGASLRARLEQASVEVTKRGWPAVIASAPPTTQDPADGTFHFNSEIQSIDQIDLNELYRAGDLIDKLRALSSPPLLKGAYFDTPSGRVWVTIRLELENE